MQRSNEKAPQAFGQSNQCDMKHLICTTKRWISAFTRWYLVAMLLYSTARPDLINQPVTTPEVPAAPRELPRTRPVAVFKCGADAAHLGWRQHDRRKFA